MFKKALLRVLEALSEHETVICLVEERLKISLKKGRVCPLSAGRITNISFTAVLQHFINTQISYPKQFATAIVTSAGALIAALKAREVEKVSQGCPFNRIG